MTLASCSNVETLNGAAQVAAEVQAALSETPYATVGELDAITNGTTEYVYWRVARTFALMELESFRAENGWDGAKLSTMPVLVYDNLGRPKYYEYRVVLEGREIGAITCVAQKRDGGPTAYVLPSPSDYSQVKTKGANTKVFAAGYPRVVFKRAAPTERGIRIMEENGAQAEPEIDSLEYIALHPEYYAPTNMSVEEFRGLVKATMLTNEAFWNSASNLISNFTVLSTNEQFIKWIREISSKKSMDFNGGRVVRDFTGEASTTTKKYWWNSAYVIEDLYGVLRWGRSPHTIWCSPSAYAFLLNYYGFTNKIRYYDKINYFYKFDSYEETVSPGTMNFSSSSIANTFYTINLSYSDDSAQYLYPEKAELGAYYLPVGSIYSYSVDSFTYEKSYGTLNVKIKVKASMKGYYPQPANESISGANFKIRISFLNTQNETARSSFTYKGKTVIGTLTDTYKDGYDQFGSSMGITNFSYGPVADKEKIIIALNWATDNKLGFSFERVSYTDAFKNKMRILIDNDIPFVSTRGPNQDLFKEKDGHARIVLGYKDNNVYQTVANQVSYLNREIIRYDSFLWWTWPVWDYVTRYRTEYSTVTLNTL